MIVRISGEDQYRIADEESGRVNELEAAVVASVEGADEAGYAAAHSAVLDFVRAHGAAIGDDEIETSDLILPPADLTFAEAGRDFTGEGLIPE
jgi:hypothetical protein